MEAPKPPDEEQRLRTLDEYQLLDTTPEPCFDRIVALAARACEAPIALFSLVDGDRQWFKARVGLEAPETEREVSFCAHAVASDDLLVVQDATTDARFLDNALVLDKPGIRFYAGAPVHASNLQPLGTLCVIDHVPRSLTADKRLLLKGLAREIEAQLEIRRISIARQKLAEEAVTYSERKFQAIVDTANEGIWTLDTEGSTTYVNPRMAELLGYEPEEMLGRTMYDFMDENVREEAHANMQKRREGVHEQHEFRFQHKDGSDIWTRIAAAPMMDDEGNFIGALGMISDITQSRLSELRLREAQRIAKIGNWERNLVTDELWWSAERYRIAGRTPGTFIPSRDAFLAMVHPADRQRVDQTEMNALATGEPYSIEYRTVLPDGSERTVHAQGDTSFDQKGCPFRFGGTVQDVTERKDAEKRLRRSEGRLKDAQRFAKIGSWERDLTTKETWWSDETYRLFGINPQEQAITHEAFLERVNPDDRVRLTRAVERALQGGDGFDMEYRTVPLGDEVRVIHGRAEVTFDEEGRPTRMYGTSQDITERKEIEESLRKSIERYDLAVRATHAGLWDWNIKTGEDYFSPRWKEILGYREDELDPHVRTFTALLHPGDRERAWHAVEAHLRDRVPYDQEFRMRHKSGGFVWVLAKGQAVWSDTGEPLRMAGSIRDVTARRATEREVVTIAEHERKRIGRDLHDGLGQELTAISLGLRAHSQELAQENLPHAQTAQTLTDLTQKAIVETQRVARLLSPMFLSEVGLSASLRALATDINTHSRVKCSVQRLEPVRVDDIQIATQLFRIAQESVNNAVKHSGAQNIEVCLSRGGGALRLEVLDDGSGISDEAPEVEGLGLRSMHYRARMINGELEISQRSEGGTRVVCSLPEVDDSQDAESLEPRLADQVGDS